MSILIKLRAVFSDYTFVIFYLLLAVCLYFVDWGKMSFWSIAATVILTTSFADFCTGLVHLYIDYRPLNYAVGMDKLYYFNGDRETEEFRQFKKSIVDKAPWFDEIIYNFKIHHRRPSTKSSINANFMNWAVPAFALLFYTMLLMYLSVFADYPELILSLLVGAALTANIEYIHYTVHGARGRPVGRRVIGLLQKLHLVYGKETHGRHHAGEGSGFCFLTGHTNFIVDYICRELLRRGIINQDHWFGLP